MSATPTVTVRGEGQVEGPPELATVSAVLQTSGRTAAEVTRTLADLARRVDAARPDLVYDSVRTAPLQVTPVFDPRYGVEITGYSGRYSTRLSLADFTGLSDLVVALSGLPGVSLDGPSWSLRRGSPLERGARLDAIRSAVTRARDYATALGADLGDLLELSDTNLGNPFASRMSWMPQSGDTEPVLDLEPQPQTVTADVTARFVLNGVPTSDALPG